MTLDVSVTADSLFVFRGGTSVTTSGALQVKVRNYSFISFTNDFLVLKYSGIMMMMLQDRYSLRIINHIIIIITINKALSIGN